MHPDILAYIRPQRICVLAVEMLDSSPHAATVHFAHSELPLVFLFETHRDYRKSEALFGRAVTRASMVIGSNESEMKTLQMDGEARLWNKEEVELFKKIYLEKFPEKQAKADDPKSV